MSEVDSAVDGTCFNCKSALNGPYCSNCGQKARLYRSLAHLFHDMIQGLFNFEGKIWRTLPMLAWRPGELTRRYAAGERARFVSPVALYLFTFFLMFAVLNFTGLIGLATQSFTAGLVDAVNKDRVEIVRLQTARKAALGRGEMVASIDAAIADKTNAVAEFDQIRRGDAMQTEKLGQGKAPLWLRQAVTQIERDPQSFGRKAQDATSKFSWLLIPLSVPFVWLLFPFSHRFRLYDHTVFVIYSLCFMTLLVCVATILNAIGLSAVAGFIFFLVPPIHIFRQLRGAYGLGWFGALWRTIALLAVATMVMVTFVVGLFGAGTFD